MFMEVSLSSEPEKQSVGADIFALCLLITFLYFFIPWFFSEPERISPSVVAAVDLYMESNPPNNDYLLYTETRTSHPLVTINLLMMDVFPSSDTQMGRVYCPPIEEQSSWQNLQTHRLIMYFTATAGGEDKFVDCTRIFSLNR
ncbi:MAG: hypothetical protein DHS20C12_11800 [Pseudohongiella sp.]|nr:MAG: hypothetical protein DHS20C12_11800 [Pseudohongiella sp.]